MARNFIPRHRKETKDFRPREHNPERDKKQSLYRGNTEWRDYCERFLSINKKCYACGGRASVVDHVIPHKGDIVLFEKLDNHIPLCENDHNFVSAKFDAKFKIGSSNHEKISWLNGRRVPTEEWIPEKVKILPNYR